MDRSCPAQERGFEVKCPNCGLINPETALRCDCGYNFDLGGMDESSVASVSASRPGDSEVCCAECNRLLTDEEDREVTEGGVFFGIMDIVFLAIVVWEAWRLSAPIKLNV
jgi:hypothetical protein